MSGCEQGLFISVQRQMMASYEHDSKSFGLVRGGKIVGELSDYYLQNKDSAPCSCLSKTVPLPPCRP